MRTRQGSYNSTPDKPIAILGWQAVSIDTHHMYRICKILVLVIFAAVAGLYPQGVQGQEVTQLGRLSITALPSSLPADGNTYDAVFVQLLDLDDIPIPSPGPFRVFLTSSDYGIASVPQEITIPRGSSYAVAPLSVSRFPGTVLLTVVAVGFDSDDVEFETISFLGANPPFHLDVSVLPPVAYPGDNGVLTVSLVDEEGVPYLAPSDIAVVLTSSSPGSLEVPRIIVIPSGAHLARTGWTARSFGIVSVQAQADMVGAGKDELEVLEFFPRGNPTYLEAYALTPSLPAWESEQQGILLQALDEERRPVAFPCTDVTLTSSAPGVVAAGEPVASPCDSELSSLIYNVSTTATPGQAVLTAGAVGLSPDSVTLPTHGLRETRLRLEKGPFRPTGTDAVPATLTVQLVDGDDRPVSFHEDYLITLLSQGAKLPDQISIPSGQSHIVIPIPRDRSESEVFLAVAAPGVEGDTISYEVEQKTMELFLDVPSSINAGEPVEITAEVLSEDVPVQGVEVDWVITSVNAGEVVTSPTNADGLTTLIVTADENDRSVDVTARVNHPGYEPAVANANTSVVSLVVATDDSPSRLPFLAAFLIVFIILLAFVIQNLGSRKYLPKLADIRLLLRQKTS